VSTIGTGPARRVLTSRIQACDRSRLGIKPDLVVEQKRRSWAARCYPPESKAWERLISDHRAVTAPCTFLSMPIVAVEQLGFTESFSDPPPSRV
jgi:hypothetical protein